MVAAAQFTETSMSAEGIDQLETTEDLLSRLQEHVWLVSLTIGWPKLSYQIEGATVTVATASSDEKIIAEKFRSSPQWHLIPEQWKERLSHCEGQARKALATYSVKFGSKGSCLLPITKSKDVFARLRELRTEFNNIAEAFTARYQGILVQLQQDLGTELFEKAEKKLPSVDGVRDKFRMTWYIVPLGGSGAIPATYWTEFEAMLTELENTLGPAGGEAMERIWAHFNQHTRAAMSAVGEDQLDDMMLEAKNQLRAMVNESIESMVSEPRQAIIDACENMIGAIRDERSIRTGTIEQIRKAFEYMEGFSFMAGDEMLTRIREAMSAMSGLTPQQLNSNRQASLALAGALQPVLSAANDAAESARQVQAFRKVAIRREPVA